MDINVEAAQKLMDGIDNPDMLLFIEGDTCKREDIKSAVEQVIAKFGKLDSLFANAGIHRSNTMLNISDEMLDRIIQTNLYGTINTLREAVPHIIASGGGSVVINASDQVFVGKANSFAYGLTKGALGQMTKSLSIDLGKDKVRVNAVCAGTIRTPLSETILDNYARQNNISAEDCWQSESELYARGSVGEPMEVAELVYFLASDASSFCTGGQYLVDGGLCAQ